MFKKLTATALLVLAVPAWASAWTFTTQAKNAGGTIASPNKALQTVKDGIVVKSYADSVNPASWDVVVTPAAGYALRAVTVAGVTTGDLTGKGAPLAADGAAFHINTVSGYSASALKGKGVSAIFAANNIAVGASMTGGTATPKAVGNIYTGTKLVAPLTFNFVPKRGYSIDAGSLKLGGTAIADGSVYNTKTISVVGSFGAVNGAIQVIFPAGTVINSPIQLSATATNSVDTLSAGLIQTKVIGKTATLAASMSTGATTGYTWTQISGPELVLNGGAKNAVFSGMSTVSASTQSVTTSTFTQAGRFVFQVTNGGLAAMTTVVVADSPTAAATAQCNLCHTANQNDKLTTIYSNWAASVHAGSASSICGGCHTEPANGAHPGSVNVNTVSNANFTTKVEGVVGGKGVTLALGQVFCTSCHFSTGAVKVLTNPSATACVVCHTPTGSGDAHQIAPTVTKESCIECHSSAIQHPGTFVNDNNGVRAITTEFAKWSHHVDNSVALNDAHCAACHMEGTVSGGNIVIDTTKHMADAKVHLRDTTGGSDTDFAWDPAAPNHSGMDNFCMSCHDADGANSPESIAIQGVINAKGLAAAGKTASPSNPFGDTISNRYDKMQRPAVVDVDGQFTTGNNSHHAVKGPRYTGRTRAAVGRQIASPSTFANNSSAVLYGVRSTIYDAGNFNSLYVPLENAGGEAAPRTGAASLGDDSTLHCGDCHTVGQYKPGSATNADGTPTTVAIGAHGSNNEYLLRNSVGTDARHSGIAYTVAAGNVTINNATGARLVCFNCHAFTKYGSPFNATGAAGPHAGEYASGGRCNGPGNTIPFNGYTTGTATDGTQFASRFDGPVTKYSSAAPFTGEQNPDFGNVFGIQCANCHNSGVENGYGGIHGSKVNTYVDGMGNTQKMERFLPGLGNTKYVPGTLGGIAGGSVATVTNTKNSAGNQIYTYTTGGVSNDTNWEQKESKRRADGAAEYAGAGCYTLTEAAGKATSGQEGLSVDGGATLPEAFGTWGGCDDHGAAQAAGDHGTYKRINRPITY